MREPTLIDALLRASAEGRPGIDGLRFVDGREQATFFGWSEVRARALRAAGALREHGVRPRERLAIILPTGPEFFDAFFGAWHAGAVPVPLYPPVRLGRLDEYFERTAAMLRVVDAVAIVADSQVRRVLGQVLTRFSPKLGVIRAESLVAGAPVEVGASAPEDLALVQFSSGTTVDPKAVALSFRQVQAQTDALLRFIPHESGHDECGVSWLPLYHDMGLIGCVFPAIVGIGPLTLIPPEQFLRRPALWIRALSRYRGTVSTSPDFGYALCVERIGDEELVGCDLSRWRLALDGAEPIAPRTLRAFRDRFAPYGLRPEALTPVYGLSEAALAVTFSDPSARFGTLRVDAEQLCAGRALPDEGGVEVVSVGRPVHGFEVEIRDATVAPVHEGRIGRIWARGPSLMVGYLGREEQPFREGWLDTGDLGFMWDGELYITGRARDLIILRGRNHAPHDIERAVDGVDGVRTGCTAAVGDLGDEGERLLVFVEARQLRPEMAEDCRKAVLAGAGIEPHLVVVVEPGTLPRTSSGKIRRGETLRRYKAGQLVPPERVNTWLLAGVLARSALGYLTARVRPPS